MSIKSVSLPILYSRSSKSETLYSWQVWTLGPVIFTSAGTVDGAKVQSEKTAEPKNVGRSNETTAEDQAILEAQAMWQKKRDRKYFETIKEAEAPLIRPMLASDFEARKNRNVTYPVHVQPKLDGVRALAFWDGSDLQVMSRSGKSYLDTGSIDHIAAALKLSLPNSDSNYAYDGEIYAHGESFQQTTRLVKKYRPGESEQLVFHVYDIVRLDDLDIPWATRTGALTGLKSHLEALKTDAGGVDLPIQVVDHVTAADESEVYRHKSEFIAEGYEGAMVRLLDGKYVFGGRSHDLLKVKTFSDAEFRITGFRTGVGKFERVPIFTCETENGEQLFEVVVKGTAEERAEMLNNASELIGQLMKVRFFELTEDGIPRFPVGLGIRASEDL